MKIVISPEFEAEVACVVTLVDNSYFFPIFYGLAVDRRGPPGVLFYKRFYFYFLFL